MTNLLSVLSSSPVRNWPSVHEHNMDYIDSLYGVTGLQTYTPQWTADTTNPTLGATTIEGVWYRFLDTIYVWGRIEVGLGFSAGSGGYRFSLPVPIHSDFRFGSTSNSFPIGSASAREIGVSTYTGLCMAETPTEFEVQDEGGAGNSTWDENDPFAWGTSGDGIGFFVMYRGAS